MGGDGGVIATQRKYLRASKDASNEIGDSKSRSQLEDKTKYCSYDSQPLTDYIVVCKLGNFYNKETIINALLNKSIQKSEFRHIKGLKDIKDAKFKLNSKNDSTAQLLGKLKYVCPVTGDELNGIHPFYIIWSTGIIISKRALREVGIFNLNEEYGPFQESDLIKLFPCNEELLAMKDDLRSKTKRRIQSLDDDIEKSHNVTTLTSADAITKVARQTIEQTTKCSNVYSKLFHKDNEKDNHDRDLFMSVAGIRYTLK